MLKQNSFSILISQIISIISAIIITFFLPKIIGIVDFGYWQVYLFYSSYVGLFQFGFNDGLYLKYGGYNFNRLPRNSIKTYFILLLFSQILISVFSLILIVNLESDLNKKFPLYFASLNITILGTNALFIMINQATERLKLYSRLIVFEKLSFIILIFIFYYFYYLNYKYIIIIDFLVKVLILCSNIYFGRDLILVPGTSIKNIKKDFFQIIKIGLFLTLANLLGIFVLGFGRFYIERFFLIEEFSLYSFSLSTTSIIIFFLSAISLVIYPIIKRNNQKMVQYFNYLNQNLFYSILVFFGLFYLLQLFIVNYLTAFSQIVDFLYILIPLTLYQGKIQVISTTYYKALRKERTLFFANLNAVILFAILIYIFHLLSLINIKTICYLTLIVSAYRCYFSELYIKKLINIKNNDNILIETIMVLAFIILYANLSSLYASLSYLLLLIIYFIFDFKNIKKSFITILNSN